MELKEYIFEGWENHDHVSSLCFVRIFALDVLITEALVYFWVGENQKLFHIVEKTLKTVIHTFSLLCNNDRRNNNGQLLR